jgi:predicted GNAT family acetyltransferase
MHVLDRPVWQSLSTHHAALAEGGALARRFVRDVNVFASACDDTPEAVRALGALIGAGESVYVGQVPPIVVPDGVSASRRAMGVQMLAPAGRTFAAEGDDMITLGDADAAEMVALAQLTQPGPFLARTHRMGTFIGVRIGGRLAAMAGTRMRLPGFTEVSGVCTHPDFRGRGLARALSSAVAAMITARGEQPFLHAWKDNAAAISLYESLGFSHRTDVHVAELRRT